eukprot:COSAG06_NODE_59714_length_273_cov_0.597701_1_plen_35_part_01
MVRSMTNGSQHAETLRKSLQSEFSGMGSARMGDRG